MNLFKTLLIYLTLNILILFIYYVSLKEETELISNTTEDNTVLYKTKIPDNFCKNIKSQDIKWEKANIISVYKNEFISNKEDYIDKYYKKYIIREYNNGTEKNLFLLTPIFSINNKQQVICYAKFDFYL